MVFLADRDLSYTDSDGTVVIQCSPHTYAEAASYTWHVIRLIYGYVRFIASL